MKTQATVIMFCFALALALGLGGVSAFLAFGPAESVGAAQGASGGTLESEKAADLTRAIAEIRAELAAMKERSQLTQVAPRALAASLDEDLIARAVAAYFEGHGGPPEAGADALAVKDLGSPEDIAALLASADPLNSVGLWKRIVAEGRDEEVLAYFKALAAANPNDPEAQLALGQAYLGRTQEAGASPLAGKYAALADEALDAALEADPEHWEARFTKATALSFWPPIFGKQASAIAEFETLVSQQAGQTPAPKHARTYLLLGNMYHQTGQVDKALQAWTSGLEQYPGNTELADQIALLSGQ